MLHRAFQSFRSPAKVPIAYSSLKDLQTSRALTFRMASTLPRLPILEAISKHDPQSTVAVHSLSGRSFTYGELLGDVASSREKLRSESGVTSPGMRVAFLVENSYDYIVTLLSCLANDSVALPLSPGFPASELRYILDNSEASALLSTEKFRAKAEEIVKTGLDKPPKITFLQKFMGNASHERKISLTEEGGSQGGMMLYTSGTTSRPKGVLLPTAALTSQAQSLIKAWAYNPSDHILHVLPLHHIHGTINALMTPLFAGSTIEFMFPFNANSVWERFGAPFLKTNSQTRDHRPISFFTVVPTIYNRLLSSHPSLPQGLKDATRQGISPKNLRVNISGSAALPTPTKTAWTELSGGNVLLERFGMTEVGMALSCGLEYADRVDGSVGWPLPSVEARLVDTDNGEVIAVGEETGPDGRERVGEIQLRGPTIFKEYWKNAKATAEEFVEDGDGNGKWFKTGDVASRRIVEGAGKSDQEWAKGPMYFISGRKSVDIIKTGGEKVSALEIERELLSLPQISEAAVVGVSSEQWGQKVAAVVVLDSAQAQSGKDGKSWGVMDMRRALKDKLVNYKIPQELKIVDSLPRNAMGKINKKNLVKDIFGDQ